MDEPFVDCKNRKKVFGEPYSNKCDPTCPKVLNYDDISVNIIKAPLKHIIMRELRHPQRYESAWVLLKDKRSIPLVCLRGFTDTMRFYIDDGVHRCHVAYDAGYDFVPAFVMPDGKEPEWLKEHPTFDGQPRNLFERMRLPAKITPETCEHRLNWRVNDQGAFSDNYVCRWCHEFKYRCFKELVGYDASVFDEWSEES